jgi:hypothetical protein
MSRPRSRRSRKSPSDPTIAPTPARSASEPVRGEMQPIEVGYPTFVADGDEEFGAVRGVSAEGLVVYVENSGEFPIPWDAVRAVHFKKVVVDCRKLDRRLREAIGHAHDAEVPGA